MKRFTPVLALAVVATAQAGVESMMNPMAMMNPAGMMNPMSAMAPMGMMAAPMGMGMMNPMGMGAPMMGMGAMYPAMQMVPNLMSFSHMNSMTNPYLGGPFQGNPYLQPALPFSPPAWGAPQSTAPVQSMPFSFPMPAAPAQAAQPAALPFAMPMPAPAALVPSQPEAQGSTASGSSPMLFDPAVWLNMLNAQKAQSAGQ